MDVIIVIIIVKSIYMYDNSIVSTINSAKIKYYGSDVFISSSTSIITSSSSMLITSQQV